MTELVAQSAVTSADGTKITFDRYGSGSKKVIIIGGVFSFRNETTVAGVARALAQDYGMTAITYDRRGRGDSGDNSGDFQVDREISDLAALIDAVGGPVSLFGWSSGAALALRAVQSPEIQGVDRIVAFEPPFVVDSEFHVPPPDFAEKLHTLVSQDQRSEVVRYFMSAGMGIPGFFVTIMRLTPLWSKLKATAPSAPYDWAVMRDYMQGKPLDAADWCKVTVPTLVMAGARSEKVLRAAAKAASQVLPMGEHREIPKLSHNANAKILAPVVGDYLTDRG